SFILASDQPVALPMTVTTAVVSNRQDIAFGLALPQIDIRKTTPATTVVPGGTLTYSIEVTNIGIVTANGTRVIDAVPGGIDGFAWTCSATAGGVCPNASGSGDIDETIAPLPVGGVVTYAITALVSTNPPATLPNTATATPPPGGVCGEAHPPPP